MMPKKTKFHLLAPVEVKSPESRWLAFYVEEKRPTEALASTLKCCQRDEDLQRKTGPMTTENTNVSATKINNWTRL